MDTKELALQLVKIWKGSIRHKISLVLVSVGAAALTGSTALYVIAALIQHFWGIANPVPTTPIWVGFAIIGLGLLFPVAELWIENRGRPASPHQHDVDLLVRFRDLIGADTRAFLREKAFYEPIPRHLPDPLERLNYEWQGALYEFRDEAAEAAFEEFKASNDEFLNFFAYSVFPLENNPDFYTVMTFPDRQCGLTPETEAKVDRMQELAAAADHKLNEFERIALDRIQ